jgi:hypothetical protein
LKTPLKNSMKGLTKRELQVTGGEVQDADIVFNNGDPVKIYPWRRGGPVIEDADKEVASIDNNRISVCFANLQWFPFFAPAGVGSSAIEKERKGKVVVVKCKDKSKCALLKGLHDVVMKTIGSDIAGEVREFGIEISKLEWDANHKMYVLDIDDPA